MAKNIVLVHGWGAGISKLKLLETELKKYGWNTFLIKLPGFDLAPPKNAWQLDDYVNFILVQAKNNFGNSKFYIFGHSFGGRVAIKTSLSAKFRKSLHGIILCSAGGISRGNVIKRTVFYIVAKVGKIFLITPKTANAFKNIIYKLVREHDYEKTEGVMRKTFQNIVEEELKDELGKVDIPTLILWGSNDAVTPLKDAYFIKKNLQNSELKVYQGKTHNLPYVEYKRLAKDINGWVKNQKY